jgi:hypothetical protein
LAQFGGTNSNSLQSVNRKGHKMNSSTFGFNASLGLIQAEKRKTVPTSNLNYNNETDSGDKEVVTFYNRIKGGVGTADRSCKKHPLVACDEILFHAEHNLSKCICHIYKNEKGTRSRRHF